MAANGISTLATKEARQIAKLDLAAAKRGQGYDRDLLPTKYVGNTLVNNPNVGGLQANRPWTSTPTPTFSVVPRNSTVNEGGNITVDITTTNFPDGNVYFTVSGVSASDIQGGTLPSGSTTVNSGASAVSFNMANDLTTEGTETLVFEVRTGSTSGPVVATCNVTINDTSLTPPPSISIVFSGPANETDANVLSFVVSSNGAYANGVTLYYTVNGTGITLGDFVSEIDLSGTFTFVSGEWTKTLTLAADQTTEGLEVVALTIWTEVGHTNNIGSCSVNITDTSLTPTYTLTPAANNVNEGTSLTFTAGGTNIVNGTYYWTITNSGDFGTASGSFSITSNTGSFSVTPTADATTEGSETFTASIRSGSITGTVLQTSISITINDTSLIPATIAEIFTGETTGGVVTVLETQFDASVSANFTPSNPADGDTFTQWTDSNAGTKNANPIGGATTRASYESDVASVQNSLAVVRFDGVNDGLSINPYPNLASKAGITVFALVKTAQETGSVNNLDPRVFSTNVSNGIALYYNSTSNQWTVAASTGVGTSTTTNDHTKFNIHTLVYDGSLTGNANRLKYRHNGVQNTLAFTGTVGTTTSASITTMYLGNSNSANYWKGDMAEYLLFTRTLTTPEIQSVETYLTNKWGLSSLTSPQSIVALQYNQSGSGYATNQATNVISVLIADYPSIVDVPNGATITVNGNQTYSANGTYTVSSPYTNDGVRILRIVYGLGMFYGFWGSDTLTFTWTA